MKFFFEGYYKISVQKHIVCKSKYIYEAVSSFNQTIKKMHMTLCALSYVMSLRFHFVASCVCFRKAER